MGIKTFLHHVTQPNVSQRVGHSPLRDTTEGIKTFLHHVTQVSRLLISVELISREK